MSEPFFHIAIASDWNYLPHAGTVFRSIYQNQRHPLFFHLMTIDPKVADDPKIRQLFDEMNSEICQAEILLIDEHDSFLAAQPQGGVTPYQSAYLRFIASDQIHADRILYLDCDTIILDDLEEIFSLDFGNKTIAAVPELFAGAFIFEKGFGLRYFNSGVMLINAKLWRENHLTEKIIHFMKYRFNKLNENKKHYGDQDILNIFFQGQVVYLHPRYNLVNPVLLRRWYFSGKLFDDAVTHPAIVHFAGGTKPWNYWDGHPLADKYLFYRKQTPWADIVLPQTTLSQILRLCSKRSKYHFSRLIYPLADFFRRVFGYPSRKVRSELIEYLMAETAAIQEDETA
ncbi:MAG: glycosyltransferase family 8 protein [Planctomycetaceae bacterium]|jgi:lipopolysaccharide biosynthesis glycosyltransferase|nr:glycosyltransferase family 8 protein [Planctomycetaceae bacterium]